MEIKKTLCLMVLGCLFCLGFATVLKGIQSKETVADIEIPVSAQEVVSVENREEASEKETSVQLTQEPFPIATKASESEGAIRESEREFEEQPTELPKETEEPEKEQEQPPERTVAPTMVPTATPASKQEEVETVQSTPQPVNPTTVPQVTQEPKPQNTQAPVVTKAPVEEEVHVHEFEKAIWELPTCQKGGYYNNICKVCGFEESVTQEPLSHQIKDVIIQEGNCMEDRVIRHICTECEMQIGSDTRYPLYDEHQWATEEVDGVLVEYCERCGVVK